MTVHPFLHLPPPASFKNYAEVQSYLRRMWDSLRPLRLGKTENVIEFDLSTGTTSTVLYFKGLSPQSVVVFDPKNAAASTEIHSGSMYVLTANRGNDQWTVTHSNSASARAFQVAIIG